MKAIYGILLLFSLFVQAPASHAAKPARDADAKQVIYTTTDLTKQTRTFTVASLESMVRSQYKIEDVKIHGVAAATSGAGIAVNIFAGAIVGPTASLSVGDAPTKRSDLFGVSMTITYAQVSHDVRCKLRFVDKAPVGKVRLEKCQSESANFADTELTFEQVGLKTTTKEKTDIPKQ